MRIFFRVVGLKWATKIIKKKGFNSRGLFLAIPNEDFEFTVKFTSGGKVFLVFLWKFFCFDSFLNTNLRVSEISLGGGLQTLLACIRSYVILIGLFILDNAYVK